MSITSLINDIIDNRNTIRDKMIEAGQATSTDKLEDLARNLDIDSSGVGFNWKTWLASAGISATGYSSLADVLADEVAIRRLFTIHASVDYLETYGRLSDQLTTILNNDLCAKWINLRDYAFDTLYADATVRGIMNTAGKYGYGEWVITDNTTTPPTWGPKGNVPVMTSDTAPYGEVTYSGYYSDATRGWKAFNGILNTSNQDWNAGANATSNTWLVYKFTNPVCVKKVMIQVAFGERIKNFNIQGSNNGTDFNTIYSGLHQNNNSIQYFTFNNDNYYLYYRLLIVDVHSGNYSGVSELQFYGRELKTSVPKMTGMHTPYGDDVYEGTPFAGEESGEHRPYYAYNYPDGSIEYMAANAGANSKYVSSFKQSGNLGLGYNFNRPVVCKMVRHGIRNNYTNQCAQTYKIQASNDGTNWIDKTAVLTDNTDAGKVTTTVLNNNEAYQYWRIFVVTNRGSGTETSLAGLQFYCEDYSEYDWDADVSRKYLYDHGVEPNEKLTMVHSQTNISEKQEYQLYFKNTTGSSYSTLSLAYWYKDLSNYNLIRTKRGQLQIKASSESHNSEIRISNVQPNSTSYSDSNRLASKNLELPINDINNEYLDISSISGNYWIMFGSYYWNHTSTCEEIWLE